MDQTHSVFMPGLTRRGPVYNAMGALPTVSPMIKYALMAGLLYLGAKKQIPFGILGGAGAAFAIWKLLPDAGGGAAAASGAPSATDISNLTVGAGDIAPTDFSQIPMPSGINFPTGSISGYQIGNPSQYEAPKAWQG